MAPARALQPTMALHLWSSMTRRLCSRLHHRHLVPRHRPNLPRGRHDLIDKEALPSRHRLPLPPPLPRHHCQHRHRPRHHHHHHKPLEAHRHKLPLSSHPRSRVLALNHRRPRFHRRPMRRRPSPLPQARARTSLDRHHEEPSLALHPTRTSARAAPIYRPLLARRLPSRSRRLVERARHRVRHRVTASSRPSRARVPCGCQARPPRSLQRNRFDLFVASDPAASAC